MHSHPVPLLGHIESGELTLAEKTGISKTFKEGDSFVLTANIPAHKMDNSEILQRYVGCCSFSRRCTYSES